MTSVVLSPFAAKQQLLESLASAAAQRSFDASSALVRQALDSLSASSGAAAAPTESAASSPRSPAAAEQTYSPTLKALLDHSFRVHTERLVFSLNTQATPLASVRAALERMFDLSLWACTVGAADSTLPLSVAQDIFEGVSIMYCAELFSLLENRADQIAPLLAPQASKNLMLRFCNDLMRRLSKSDDAEFCGRVLMLLARVYPLSDRSGLNKEGKVNTAGAVPVPEEGDTTDTVSDMLVDADQAPLSPPLRPSASASATGASAASAAAGGALLAAALASDDPTNAPVDFKFYRQLLGLQQHFTAPHALLEQPDTWSAFSLAFSSVLSAFESHHLGAGVVGTAAVDVPTQYLTSTRLVALQLRDPSFRRHVLLQALILFNWLHMNLNRPASATPATASAATAAASAAAAAIHPSVAAQLRDALPALEARALAQLKATPPNGEAYTAAVVAVLQYERRWITWKRDGCPSFERESVELPAAPASTALPAAIPRMSLGTPELDRLWKLCDAPLPTQPLLPDVTSLLGTLRDELDPENGIEDTYKKQNDRLHIKLAKVDSIVGDEFPEWQARQKLRSQQAEEQLARQKALEAHKASKRKDAEAKGGDATEKQGEDGSASESAAAAAAATATSTTQPASPTSSSTPRVRSSRMRARKRGKGDSAFEEEDFNSGGDDDEESQTQPQTTQATQAQAVAATPAPAPESGEAASEDVSSARRAAPGKRQRK